MSPGSGFVTGSFLNVNGFLLSDGMIFGPTLSKSVPSGNLSTNACDDAKPRVNPTSRKPPYVVGSRLIESSIEVPFLSLSSDGMCILVPRYLYVPAVGMNGKCTQRNFWNGAVVDGNFFFPSTA